MRGHLYAALDYAARGLAVLPLDGKRPRIRDWPKAASTDEARIREWWSNWPDAGVGLRAGKLESGEYLVVLDVDGHDGSDSLADLESEYGSLPVTVSAATPRGQHYYYRSPRPVRNSAGDLATGLDVRGEGGYVVAPPGEGRKWDVPFDEAELAELPGWIVERPQRPMEKGSRTGSEWTALAATGAPDGSRNVDTASYAGRLLRKGHTPAEVVELMARLGNPPLDRAEVERTVESIARREARRNGIEARSFATILPERVEWLPGWEGRIPAGMLTLLVGDPGLGKSLVTVRMAAEVSRAGHAALLLSAEDSPAITVRPRLEAARADLTRVRVVEAQRDGLPTGLALPDDADALARLVGEHAARLVVVDPLMAHLPAEVNSWRDQSVRRALAPLHRLADEHRCAVVIVAHLNKSGGSDALHRTGGSIGIPAAARSALLLARDPADPEGDRGARRVLAHAKSNVSRLASSLLYAVEPADVGGIETARLLHLGESEAGAEALLSHGGEGERTATDEAREFLLDSLADRDWHESQAIKAKAKSAGHSQKAIRRAREALEVETDRRGFPAVSVWRLAVVPSSSEPEGTTEEGTTAQPQSQGGNPADPAPGRAPSQIEGTSEQKRAARLAVGVRIASPEEADAERVRATFAAESPPDDDLSDLGPEQPLPSRTPKARDPEPCGCERPLPDGEGGCFQCGRALGGESL